MIEILTATFNRASTLGRLYESLLLQTESEFRWVIVDDGSVDNTREVVNAFIDQNKLEISYHHQINSGKHVAINNGINLLHGDWVFIVDSDDALECNAIEIIKNGIREHGSRYAGLCYRKSLFNGLMVGRSDPNVLISAAMSPSEASKLFCGDLAYIFQVEYLASNPFPVIPGENFVPELYVWNKISLTGGIYYYGDVSIYLCEYLEDGYSLNFKKNLRKNPLGFLIFYISQVRYEASLVGKLKCIIRTFQCLAYAMRNSM